MTPPLEPKAYQAVLASPRWRALRARLLTARGRRCERCGKTWGPGYKDTLQLHHLTYERLGQELDTDLQFVCAYCHDDADAERAVEAKYRADEKRYTARVWGWAEKRYGRRLLVLDWERLVEEFERFLARHEE